MEKLDNHGINWYHNMIYEAVYEEYRIEMSSCNIRRHRVSYV